MSSEYSTAPPRNNSENDGAVVRSVLRAWILGKNGNIDPGKLSDQTPIFEARYLRSLHLPELILLIERLSGAPIDVEDFTAGDFRDIDTIVAQFIVLSGDGEHAA